MTIASDPLYSLSPHDVEEITIFEERSLFVEGQQIFSVIAEPTEDWLSRTQQLRDSYPYDTVAWLSANQLVAVGPNVNARQIGSIAVAAFFCRSEATEFAAKFDHDPTTVTQSEAEYRALLDQMNTNYQESLAELRAKPQKAAKFLQHLTPEVRDQLLGDGIPAFPVEPTTYYGPDYQPMVCS